MTVKQISVFTENKPGKIAALCSTLSENNIDLRALSVAEAADFGIVRILVDDAYAATTVLKDANYVCSITKVIAAEVNDEPGALAKIVTVLGDAGINIEYMYAVTNRKFGKAYMIIRVADNQEAISALQKAGMRVVCQEDMKLDK
ncbi:MAG: ACT domain-containing protein [Eubacteriales bacterium]|nr:ACT domain-containing protein [Eubacteriales bacterium]